MIAVTFALPAESKAFISRLQNKRSIRSPGGTAICGESGSNSVTIFHTGVGRKICETKIADFIREQHPDVLISSGFAGAASPNLEVGDLFLAQNFSDPELSRSCSGLSHASAACRTLVYVIGNCRFGRGAK